MPKRATSPKSETVARRVKDEVEDPVPYGMHAHDSTPKSGDQTPLNAGGSAIGGEGAPHSRSSKWTPTTPDLESFGEEHLPESLTVQEQQKRERRSGEADESSESESEDEDSDSDVDSNGILTSFIVADNVSDSSETGSDSGDVEGEVDDEDGADSSLTLKKLTKKQRRIARSKARRKARKHAEGKAKTQTDHHE